MLLKTKQFLEFMWRELRHVEHYWETKEDFFYWAERQGVTVDASAQEVYLTKIDYRQPLGPSNARVVNIHESTDFNRVVDGAILWEIFGGEYA